MSVAASFLPSVEDDAAKRNTNLSLPDTLVDEARRLGINLSKAAARGLAEEIAEKRAAQWLEDNRSAIADWNRHIDEQGVPLSRFRQF